MANSKELIAASRRIRGLETSLRPYMRGITPHEHGIASIVLYTNEENGNTNDKEEVRDYLTSLTGYISELESAAITQGGEIQPDNSSSGKVPILYLDNNASDKGRSAARPYYGVFNNFSLNSVNEAYGETIKLQQNFTDGWNAFFFGEKPMIFSFAGVFIDSAEYPYYQEFMVAYGKYLAGRKCVENKMKMKIMYDGKIVDGYMISISTISEAMVESLKAFTFTVLVKKVDWVRMNIIIPRNSNGEALYFTHELNGMTNQYRFIGESFEDSLAMTEDPAAGSKNAKYRPNRGGRPGGISDEAMSEIVYKKNQNCRYAGPGGRGSRPSGSAPSVAFNRDSLTNNPGISMNQNTSQTDDVWDE